MNTEKLMTVRKIVSNFGLICVPLVSKKSIITGVCPDCKKHTRFLTFFYEWYGSTQVCIRCGRCFEDGEWMPFPFERGNQRKISIEKAKKRWRKEDNIYAPAN